MGYFSNSTEFEYYAERWCSRCIHEENCAVLMAHYLHNYEECNKPDSILNVFIPRSTNGDNEQCRMFVAKEIEDKIAKNRALAARPAGVTRKRG